MLYTSSFVIKDIKDGPLISKKQNFKNESFKMGFNAHVNQNNRTIRTENKKSAKTKF